MTGGVAAESDAAWAGAARIVRIVGFVTLAAMAVVGIYAALEWRPLFADGFYYLTRILENELLMLPTPGRRLPEWLAQLPLHGAIRLGVSDIGALAVIFGLSLQLLPVALTALCWAVLPRDRKHFFLYPLLHFFAGSVASSFAAIAAGATASALFWLLLFFILFRTTRTRLIDLAVALALPTVILHEAMVFLAPVLAIAAVWRAWGATTRGDRIVFAVLVAWFAVVTAVHVNHIASPLYVGHGARFLDGLLSGAWVIGGHGDINLPAVVGLAGLVLLGALALLAEIPGAWGRRLGWAAVAGFAAVAVAATAFVAVDGRMLAVGAQFAARNQALLVSLPLGLAAVIAAIRPATARIAVFRQSAAACAVMAAVAIAWHVNATYQWSRYIAIVRGMLDAGRGFVDWEAALARRTPAERRLIEAMTHDWTIAPMSIALARGGRVKAILGQTAPRGWRPFDPRDPATLPVSRFWDLSGYRAALAQEAPGPERR